MDSEAHDDVDARYSFATDGLASRCFVWKVRVSLWLARRKSRMITWMRSPLDN